MSTVMFAFGMNPTVAASTATAPSELGPPSNTAISLNKVRGLGPEAKALADRSFIETAVRLHRAGEGAAYAGLKPAGIDHGPAIPAAERAVETRSLAPVKALLVEELEHGLHARLAHVQEAQKEGLKEPQTTKDVPAARKRVNAELEFVTYVEGLRQAIHGAPEHKD
jgi:hypothetical protein